MSLRVALVCPYSLDEPGGVATHVLGLARWLRDEGHRPLVVAPGEKHQEWGVPVTLLGAAHGFQFNGSVARLAIRPAQTRLAAEAVTGSDVVHVHEPSSMTYGKLGNQVDDIKYLKRLHGRMRQVYLDVEGDLE